MSRPTSGGHVEKRKNSMRIHFVYNGEKVRETIKVNGVALLPTLPNYAFAVKVAAKIVKDIEKGVFDYAEHFPDSQRVKQQREAERTAQQAIEALMPTSDLPKNSLGALLDLWVRTKGQKEGSTKSGYASAARFWKKLFGATTPVADIDHKLAEAIIGEFKWKSAKQFNNYMIVLRGAFALEYRKNPSESPVSGVTNQTVVAKLPDPFTADERDKILDDMLAHHDVRVYAYFLWQFNTGMRPEETIALRWSDVDWNEKMIRVQRVRTFRGSEREGTKTGVSRDVELVGPALEALKLMKPYTFMKRVEREGKDRHDNSCDIFERPAWYPADGSKGGKPSAAGPWHDDRSQRDTYWKPTLKRLGIRYRTAYNTRHTFCTVALMAGVFPAYIAQQAGHDIRTLLSKYARWIPGADGGKVRLLMEKAFGGERESRKGRRPAAANE